MTEVADAGTATGEGREQLDDDDALKFELIGRTYGRFAVLLSGLTALGIGAGIAAGLLVLRGVLSPAELTQPAALLAATKSFWNYLTVSVGTAAGAALSTLVWFTLRSPRDVRQEGTALHPLAVVFGLLVIVPVVQSLFWGLTFLIGVAAPLALVLTALFVAWSFYQIVVQWSYTLTEGLPVLWIGLAVIGAVVVVLAGAVTFLLGLWPPLGPGEYVILGIYAMATANTLNNPKTYVKSGVGDVLVRLHRSQPGGSPEGGADPEAGPDPQAVLDEAVARGRAERYEELTDRYRSIREAAPEGVSVGVDVEAYDPETASDDEAGDLVHELDEWLDVHETYVSAADRVDAGLDATIPAAAGREDDADGVVATFAANAHPDGYDDVEDARAAANLLRVVAGVHEDADDDEALAERIVREYEDSAGDVTATAPAGEDLEAIESVVTRAAAGG